MQRIEEGLLEEIGLLGGGPTTGRFLFYRLVEKGVLDKEFRKSDGTKPERQPIKDVNEVLTESRWSNVIPFGQL